MYEEYWGLTESPFDNSPNPRFLYLSPEHEEALMRMIYAVKYRKGFALLTGEVGSGKTMLSRVLIKRLADEKYEIALLTNPCLNSAELIREILYELGYETGSKDKSDLLHLLHELVFENLKNEKDIVIIIDEAQLIEDNNVFEELRLLLNLQLDNRFLITMLLFGQPELREKVKRLRQLDQRVVIRYHLNTLDYFHTKNYILHRLKMAGRTTEVFTEGAIKQVFDFTNGIPREINNICDICLLIGFSKKLRSINGEVVEGVIRERLGEDNG